MKDSLFDPKLEKVVAQYRKIEDQLSPEVKEYLSTLLVRETGYQMILSQLNFASDDPMIRDDVRTMLDFHFTRHLELTILEQLSKEQAENLDTFLDQTKRISPNLSVQEIIFEFALRDDQLMQKVYETVPEFVGNFVSEFNK